MRRIAVVHDWLTTYAGSERVLEQILKIYPEADLFSVCDFIPESERSFLHGRLPTTTFIQHLPWARKRYRNYLPLMPIAVEQLDLSSYDLVISSSHAVAKGVLTGPDQLHISYIHSPIRYAWDLQHQYLRESGLDKGFKGWFAKWLLHRIRLWDFRTANGVDHFIANSQFIARRIEKVYRRDATVIYPPVEVDRFHGRSKKEDFFLTASRLVPYKRIDVIIKAFAGMPGKRLVVIGDGPERKKLEKIVSGYANIEMLGYQSSDCLADYMSRCRAFVFAAEEDFGIVPVEAQACGTPVLAYGRGGAMETVQNHRTGILYPEQSPEAIRTAVREFEEWEPNYDYIRRHALSFSSERFRSELQTEVTNAWNRFSERRSISRNQ